METYYYGRQSILTSVNNRVAELTHICTELSPWSMTSTSNLRQTTVMTHAQAKWSQVSRFKRQSGNRRTRPIALACPLTQLKKITLLQLTWLQWPSD